MCLCVTLATLNGLEPDMDLYLIRHAESELNIDRRFIGGRSQWCELSARGKQQSIALGEWLKANDFHFDRVISSSAIRAQQTARWALQGLYPLEKIEVATELIEINMGDFEGQPRQDTYTPEIVAAIQADPWDYVHPNGESQHDVANRMIAWIDAHVVARHQGTQDAIAIVSHGLSIRCLLSELFDWPREGVLEVPVRNTSLTHLRFLEGKGWELVSQDRLEHLESAGLGALDGIVRPTEVITAESK